MPSTTASRSTIIFPIMSRISHSTSSTMPRKTMTISAKKKGWTFCFKEEGWMYRPGLQSDINLLKVFEESHIDWCKYTGVYLWLPSIVCFYNILDFLKFTFIKIYLFVFSYKYFRTTSTDFTIPNFTNDILFSCYILTAVPQFQIIRAKKATTV